MDKLFDYTSLLDIVNGIKGQFPRLNDKFQLNTSDAINWGVQVLNKLVYGVYERQPIRLEVSNNIVKIPLNVKLIDGIYKLNCNNILPEKSWLTDTGLLPIRLIGGAYGNIISNTCTNNFCSINCDRTVSINFPYLIFNFTDGCIVLDAKVMKVDSNNIPMIPDEVHTIKAVEEYILMKWLREPAELQEYDWNKWLGHKLLYEDSFKDAKAFWLIPNQMEAVQAINAINNKFNMYKIRKR